MKNQPLVHLHNGNPVTSSQTIAAAFGVPHNQVMRDIKKLKTIKPAKKTLSWLEFFFKPHLSLFHPAGQNERRPNFEPSHFLDDEGRRQACFLLDRTAFVMLAKNYDDRPSSRIWLAFSRSFDLVDALLFVGRSYLDAG